MNVVTAIAAAAGLGLASSLHCAAMCGPLVGASCTHADSQGTRLDANKAGAYAGARALGYGIGGALAGALGAPIAGSWQMPVRVLAAVAAAFVIARAGVRLLKPTKSPELVSLGLSKPKRRAFPPALLGLATAVFPCGALLGGLLLASTTGSALVGSLAMITFSLASLPGLLGAVFGVATLGNKMGRIRVVAGAMLLALAGVTVVEAAMAAVPGKQHACCQRKQTS